jgi:hypothetical protein
MTASAILHLAVTVAVVQGLCDALAHWRIFRQEPYQRCLENVARAEKRQVKAAADAAAAAAKESAVVGGGKTKAGGKAARLAKQLERCDQDLADATATVAHKHMSPNMMTSLVFVVLLKVLGAEHKGQVVGLLPFEPYTFLQRITARGLEFAPPLMLADDSSLAASRVLSPQAFSFVFLYFLTGLTVKFYVSRVVGRRPPGGAADSMVAMTQSSWGKSVLKSAGIDPDDMKLE